MDLDLKQKIDIAFQKYYPTAANASGAGYLVLDENHRIARIDPVAQSILKTTEAQCLGESLKVFMPPDTGIVQHDLLVDGVIVAFEKATQAGTPDTIRSMGQDAQGKTKTRNVRAGDGTFINVKIDIALLPVEGQNMPIAVITQGTVDTELNLREGKELVVKEQGDKDAKIKLAEQASSTFRKELFAWSNAFQMIFGTSRLGKILSVFTPIVLFLVTLYAFLIAFKVIPPPDFSTNQTITIPDIPGDDSASGDRTPARGHTNKK